MTATLHGPPTAPARTAGGVTEPTDSPLDALAIELGRLAAERDFAKTIEHEADADLSSPQESAAS